MTEDHVAKQAVDAAYRMHTILGPGLLESVYEAVLAGELQKRGLHLVRQHPIPVVYEGTRFEIGFRADLIVEDKVIVEIKSIAEIAILHKSSFYLPASGGEAVGVADQLQRGHDQTRHNPGCQRTGRIISRQDRQEKPQ